SQVELEWVASTLSKFSSVWGELSNANRARLLQALLKSVRVDQVSGEVEMEFYSPVAQEAA
ncbi:MAG: recombinase family protein, partial [Myxococcaceae bacterium]